MLTSILHTVAKFIAIPMVFVLSSAGYHFNNVHAPISAVATPKVTVTQNLGGFNPSGGTTYRLQSSIGTTDVIVNLSSFAEPISGIPYTMSYLNSTIEYGTLDPQTTHSEFISFTGITQNPNGTAQLTGVIRGLSRSPGSGGCVGSTTLAQAHAGQSIFILSNPPCFYSQYAVKANDETITGSWTVPTPLANGNPTNKAYVDALVNGGTVSNNRIVVAGTAGETISIGQVLYYQQATAEWFKAATSIPEASSTILGIAQGSGTVGNPVTNGVLTYGLDSNQSGLTPGSTYYVSSTLGGIGTTATSRTVGKAKSTTNLYFDPYFLTGNILNSNNVFTGTNTFSSSTIIGSFPAFSIGKHIFIATTTQTFNRPSGVNIVDVQCVGGGGGGGSNGLSQGGVGSGGGAGSYIHSAVDLTNNSTVLMTIGAGGTSKNSGGDTTFGSFLTAKGGGAGNSFTSSIAAVSIQVGGIGGAASTTASTTVISVSGGDGTNASFNSQTASANIAMGGNGGASFFGGGGAGAAAYTGSTAGGNGGAGEAFGSGGGGGANLSGSNVNGGTGNQGACIVTW